MQLLLKSFLCKHNGPHFHSVTTTHQEWVEFLVSLLMGLFHFQPLRPLVQPLLSVQYIFQGPCSQLGQKITQTNDISTSREKNSLKSTPFFWSKPFSTNHALYFTCLAQSMFNLNKTCSLLSFFHSKTSPTHKYYSFKKHLSLYIAFFHFITMNLCFLITFKLPCICYHDKLSGWSTSLKVGTLLWIFHNLRL